MDTRAMPRAEYKALRAFYRSQQPKPFDVWWAVPLLVGMFLAPLMAVGAVVAFAVVMR
jgi:hypothetical protein